MYGNLGREFLREHIQEFAESERQELRMKTQFMKRTEIFCLLLSLCLLLTGGFVYLLFRPHTLRMFSWLRILNIEDCFAQMSFNSESKFLAFCVYSLPTGFWALSAIILCGLIWKNSPKTFLSYSLAFIIWKHRAGNIAGFPKIPGTFDFADVLVVLISLLAGILTYTFLLKGGSYES